MSDITAIEYETYARAEMAQQREMWRLRKANYRAAATEAFASWRLGCISVKRDWFPEQEIFKIGVGEIATLRLQAAYLPVLGTLRTIEEKLFRLMKACSYERDDKRHVVRLVWSPAEDPPPLFIEGPSADFIAACHRDLLPAVERAARLA